MVRIPVEYQEVEYLESSGTQCINLGMKPSNTAKIVVVFESKKRAGEAFQSIAGCQTGSGAKYERFSGIIISNNLNFRIVLLPGGSSDENVVLPNEKYVNAKRTYTINCKDCIASVDNYSLSISRPTITQLYDLYVLARNDAGTATTFATGKLYNISYEDGDVVSNLIPCYRKSDSEPGMYDTVSGTFFTNAGTGTFLVGNDVSWDTASLIERRRQILLNTPHLATESANPLTFQTDISANLKDCKIYFEPVQEGSGDPSPDNVRPISGWTGIEFYNSSPNIFPLHPPATAFRGQFSTGDTTISSASILKCWTIYVGKNKKLTYQRKATGTSCNLAFCDTPLTSRTGAVIYNALNMTNRSNQYINSGEHPYLVMCATDTSYAPGSGYDIKELMLSFGTTVKPYAPRVDNNLIIPDWESEVGEVYGGYVDLVKGEVVEEWSQIASYNGETLPGEWISDRDVYTAGTSPTIGAQVAYKLATLITHQLTPQTIKTLKGTNNIWSDANGNIEVKFWKH